MKKLIAFLLAFIMVMAAIPMNMLAITYDDFSTVLSPNATIGFNKMATSKMNEEIRYIGAYPYYHYSAAAGSYKNNELVFSFKPLDVALSDYPFIKVSYRTDTTSSIIDVSMSTPAGEKWMNKHPSAVNNGGWNTFIINYNDIVGSTAAFPSPGERNITIKLKPFGTDCNLEKNCYFDISYVALFKTEAEAEAFTYNKFYSNAGSGYDSNILTPMAIYSAFGSASAVSDISYTMLTSESSYVRYVAAPGTYNNNQLILSFTHDAFSLTEYPYVNICYRTDSPKDKLDISIISQKGENWLTPMPAIKNDGTMINVIFSINKMTGNSEVSAPDAGDMSIRIRLKPWGPGDKTITKSSYFDIYYIGFFKTELEATEFLYPGDSEYVFGYDDNLVPDYRFASKPVVRKYIDEADARANEIIHTNNTVPYENHLALTNVTGAYTGDYKDSAYVLTGTSGKNAASSYVTFTQNDVDLKNFPYVKLGYTTDSASLPTFAYKNSSGASTTVSASNGVYDLSSANSIKSFLIYPFGSTSRTLASSEHFSLEYVGVFKTKAEAEAYTYKGEHGDNMTDTHIIYTANLLDPASTATGTKYFVSSSGSASANGTSPSTPWSFAKFVSTAPSNCTVYFKRGDSFRYTGSLATKENTVYTSYGYGDKPKLIASIDGTGADKWETTSDPNIWRFKQTINNSGQAGDVGHIRINGGELWGIKITKHNTDDNRTDNGAVFNGRTHIEPLAGVAVNGGLGLYNDLEFHHDYSTGYLYLYCADGNPGSVFKSIEIADKGNAVRNESYVTFDNFYITGAGSHGIAGGHGYGAVSNCFFDWIGGSIQALTISSTMPLDPVRFGNAVQIYGNAYDFTIKNCFASQIYDCCWTVQYLLAADFKNVFMYDNVSEFANSGLEVWQGGGTNDNMHLYDNYTMFGGYGWSHQRPLKDGNFFYGGTSINSTVFTNCSVDNNVNILSSTYGNLVAAVGSTRYNFNNNVYILGENKYYARAPYDTENGTGSGANIPYNFANLHRVYSRGTESGSTFYYVPADIMSIGDDPYEIFNVSSNPIKSISIDKDYVLLKSGEFADIKVSFSPSNATDSELFYSTTNENIASINSDGRINAIVPGYATITVSSIDSGVSASVDVFVVSAPDTGTLCSLEKADGDNTNVLFAGDSLLLGEKSLPALMKEDYHITSEVYASGKALAESGICEAIKNSELDYDIAFLFVGLNDFVNCTDTNDFKASVTDIAGAVYENNYNAKIILVTPPMITSKNNSAGVSLSEYVNAVNEVNDEIYADVADLYANGVNDYVLYDKNSNPGQRIGNYIHDDMIPSAEGSALLYADLITEICRSGRMELEGFEARKFCYSAEKLSVLATGGIKRKGFVDDSTGTFVSFIPSSSTSAASNDNTYIQINFDDNGHKLVDNPILKIYYRSNIAASAAKLDINAGVLYNGASTRMWGNALNYTKDGSLQSVTIDLTKALTGGEKISSVTSADEGTPITYLRLKPYNYNQTITPGDYFDIESIAFYSSLEEAAIDGMPTFEKPADGKIGDADGDGAVTMLDLVLVSRGIADWYGYKSNFDYKASDVNLDGYVNLVDPIIIARYMANWSGYDKYFK